MKKYYLSKVFLLGLLALASCKDNTSKQDSTTEATNETVVEETAHFGGATLYSVRDAMATEPKKTIKAVSDIGYEFIEATNYEDGKFYGMTPQDFKAYLDSVDLKPLSAHMGMVTMENADTLIADVKAAGFKYFVIPVPPMGMFTFDPETRTLGMKGTKDELKDILVTLGEKCNAAGLQLLYHNHDFEFKPGEDNMAMIDYLLQNTDPALVNFQMDLYWVTKAGADPVAYFNEYPGRFKIWHVKDMDKEGRFAPVGEGTIDFKRIYDAREKSGMEYYIVEQDQTFNHEPLEAIEISHNNLTKFGFE